MPAVVRQCAKFIRKYGLKVEGIFRIPGDMQLVSKLQHLYNLRKPVNLIKEVGGHSSEDEEESAPPPPPAAWSFADVLEPAKDGGTDGAEVTGKKGGKGKGKRGKGKGKTLLFGNTGHRRM